MYERIGNYRVIYAEHTSELVGHAFGEADVGLTVIDNESSIQYHVSHAGIGFASLATFTQPGTIQVKVLAPAATVTPDLGGYGNVLFTLQLDRDSAIATPTNAPANSIFWIMFVQFTGAPWVPTFSAAYKHQEGLFLPAATVAGNSDTVGYVWDGTYARELSRASNVS